MCVSCDSCKGGVSSIRKRGVMVMGGCEGVWEGVITFRSRERC